MEERMLMFSLYFEFTGRYAVGRADWRGRTMWRQRMAGLRTNALVATSAAVLF